MTLPLIDKNDNFELVRDTVADILATESALQVALATSAGKPDPRLWSLNVYAERSNPWSLAEADGVPIVNVWVNDTSVDTRSSNPGTMQEYAVTVNIDCYGHGTSRNNPAGGHVPGDREAALTAQRAARLVRNILMAPEYILLGLRGVVLSRMVRNITLFQPPTEQGAEHVVGARVALSVDVRETVLESAPNTLDYLHVDIKRDLDGRVVAVADYDYTTN